ncbi:T9SS type A sorting domain-containing protein [Flavobacteriales bacterium]|nr:T9SS type A sorting domain-containing protein [Flavobacteriales bacterium]
MPHYRKKYVYVGQLSGYPEVEGIPVRFIGVSNTYLRTTYCYVSCIQQKDDFIYRFCDTCDCYAFMEEFRKLTLEENSIKEIKVYPNPFLDEINIDFEDNQVEGMIKILNISGRVIIEKRINNHKKMRVNLSEVPSGVYIVSLESNEQKRYAKIVKH